MREKNKNNAKLVLIIALAAIAVFVIVIIIKLAAPAKIAAASEYVGQWIDKQHTNASLDLWDTDGTNLIGMSTWQIDSDNAAFLDFEAKVGFGGLDVTNCKRTDMYYDPEGNVTETIVYETANGKIKKNADGTLVLQIEGDEIPSTFTFILEGAY